MAMPKYSKPHPLVLHKQVLVDLPDVPTKGFKYSVKATRRGGIDVIEFRPPLIGEFYYNTSLGCAVRAESNFESAQFILVPDMPTPPDGFLWMADAAGVRIRRRPRPYEWFMSEGRSEGPDRPLCDSNPSKSAPERFILCKI